MSLASTLIEEEQKLLACVHCGLCLEACPTYVITGDENDGPRGRIYLMRAVAEARLSNTSTTFERHIDRCLGCRACEQVCPAGVEYGQLLEAGRAELFSTRRSITSGILGFLLRHVWPYPRRLQFAFAVSRVMRDMGFARLLLRTKLPGMISARMEFALALLESSRSQGRPQQSAAHVDNVPLAGGGQRDTQSGSGMLFKGCVGEGLFARINDATSRVLKANGCRVRAPNDQVCCGALHAHAGDLEGARKLARRNIEAFETISGDPIVTNAGGCGAMLVSYHQLLSEDELFRERAEKFSARVRDVSQMFEGDQPLSGPVTKDSLVTYDASCHLMYGQHAAESSLGMLRSISDLQFTPLRDYERCCGGAGIYNLMEPKMSAEVLQAKLACIRDSGADTLATGNPGCQMQIGAGAMLAGMKLRVCHPIELIDEYYQQSGL